MRQHADILCNYAQGTCPDPIFQRGGKVHAKNLVSGDETRVIMEVNVKNDLPLKPVLLWLPVFTR